MMSRPRGAVILAILACAVMLSAQPALGKSPRAFRQATKATMPPLARHGPPTLGPAPGPQLPGEGGMHTMDEEVARVYTEPDFYDGTGRLYLHRYRDASCSELMGDVTFETQSELTYTDCSSSSYYSYYSCSSYYSSYGYQASEQNTTMVDKDYSYCYQWYDSSNYCYNYTYTLQENRYDIISFHQGSGSSPPYAMKYTGCNSYYQGYYYVEANSCAKTGVQVGQFDSTCRQFTMPWGEVEYVKLFESSRNQYDAPYGWISAYGLTGTDQVAMKVQGYDCGSAQAVVAYEAGACYYFKSAEYPQYNSVRWSFTRNQYDDRTMTLYYEPECQGKSLEVFITYGYCAPFGSKSALHIRARGKVNEWALVIILAFVLALCFPLLIFWIPCTWPVIPVIQIVFLYIMIHAIYMVISFGGYPFDTTGEAEHSSYWSWLGD